MSRTHRFGILLAAVALTAVACGGSDSSNGETASEAGADQSETMAPGTASETDAAGETETDAAGTVENLEIGLISHNAASPGIKLYKDVFKEAAPDSWTIHDVDTQGDVVAAQNQISDWIAQGVDAIVVDTIPNEALGAAIEEANAAGIPWFSVASGEVEGITNEVTGNDYESALELTKLFFEELGGDGRVVKLNWTGLDSLLQRDKAFHDVLAEYPDIELVEEVELQVPGWFEDANNQVTNILMADKNIDGIWLGWDDFAPDVVRAIEAAGLEDQITVVGHDLDPAAADLLRQDGPFQMTMALPIPDEARWTVDAIQRNANGEELDTVTYMDTCLATPDTIPAEGGRENPEFWDACP